MPQDCHFPRGYLVLGRPGETRAYFEKVHKMGRVPTGDRVTDAWKDHYPYLVDLAFRMLGNIGAAEDVVQEAFSRLLRAGTDDIQDERGWLIVVTSRLCLDQVRSAHSRRERSRDTATMDAATHLLGPASVDPADRVTLDDNVRLALFVVLERLTPAERVVFVLHDIFQMPFDLIGGTVGPPATCRQLARRARRKVEEANRGMPVDVDAAQHQLVTERFIAACSSGDLNQLLSVLDPTSPARST